MSRLRATLSTDPLDKALTAKMDEAHRALVAALRLCDDSQKTDVVTRRRVAHTRRDIQRALGAITGIRRVARLYDVADSNLSDTPAPRRERPAPPPEVVVEQGE